MPSRELVTMTEIAELAQVRRPTVSNWRRRHEDFPRPVRDHGSQPLFDAEQVAAWLARRPIPAEDGRRRPAERTYGDRFRANLRLRAVVHALDLLRDALARTDMTRFPLALAALRAVADRPLPDTGQEIARLARAVEDERPDLSGVFTPLLVDPPPQAGVIAGMVEDLIQAAGPAGAAEHLIDWIDRALSLRAQYMTPAGITDLVAFLVGDVTNRRVFDPAAGTGSLLLRVLDTGTARAVTAADLDPEVLRTLRHRLLCHGIAAEVVRADSLDAWAVPESDVILVDPPFLPGEREAEKHGPLAWAEQAVRHLAPGGRAYVVVPVWALTRQGNLPTVRLRESLLARGALTKVIQLPRRIHSFRTGTELAVLVLAPPGEGGDEVVLCNADRIADEAGDGWVEEVARLASVPDPNRPEVCRAVRIDELRDRSILPAHRLGPTPTMADHVGTVNTLWYAALDALQSPDPWLERLHLVVRQGRPEHVRIEELVRAGRLRLLPGHRIATDDIGREGHPAIGKAELLGQRRVGERAVSATVLDRHPAVEPTKPGDVVVLTEREVRALVDEQGGSVVLSPAQVLRIAPGRPHPLGPSERSEPPWMRPRVLAQLLTAPRNASRYTGSTVRRVSLRELELPVLDPEEVARLDEFLAELDRRLAALRRQVSVLDQLGSAVVEGAAHGVLGIGEPPIDPR